MVYFHIFPNIKEILDIKIILQNLSCTKKQRKNCANENIFSLSVCGNKKSLRWARKKKTSEFKCEWTARNDSTDYIFLNVYINAGQGQGVDKPLCLICPPTPPPIPPAPVTYEYFRVCIQRDCQRMFDTVENVPALIRLW